MKTQLNLQHVRTANTKSILLVDSSFYNPDLPVENAYLEVVVPNFSGSIQVLYVPGTVTVLNTKNLRLSTEVVDMHPGIYHVRQSIKPNDKLFNETAFLHAPVQRKCIGELYCAYKQIGKEVDVLYDLHCQLGLAEDLVEQGMTKEGLTLFNLLATQLNALQNEL